MPLPRPIGSTPEANGSKVPPCPTRFNKVIFLTRRTTSILVIPTGLYILMTSSPLVNDSSIRKDMLGIFFNFSWWSFLRIIPEAELSAITMSFLFDFFPIALTYTFAFDKSAEDSTRVIVLNVIKRGSVSSVDTIRLISSFKSLFTRSNRLLISNYPEVHG